MTSFPLIHRLVCLAVFGAVCFAQTLNPPVRLVVLPEKASCYAGETLTVNVELRDAYNLPVSAPKVYSINLEVRTKDKVAERQKVVIPTRERRAGVRVVLREAGYALIKATHPELREDAAYVRVGFRRGGFLQRPPGTAVAPWFTPVAWSGAAAQPDGQPPPQHSLLFLDLLPSTVGAKLTANGSDTARITAFLSDRASREIRLFLHADGGLLEPNPLIIAAGQDFNVALLRSEQVGIVTVKYIRSNAENVVRLRSGGEMSVSFDFAVKEIAMKASPPRVPLGEHSEIQVEFLDLRGDAIQLPADKEVFLTVDSGLGDIEPNPIVVPANKIQGRARLTPRSMGEMHISASSHGARSRNPLTLDVHFPYWIFVVEFSLGALANFLTRICKGARWSQVLLAAVLAGLAAIVVCGAAQFGLNKVLPPKVVMHPIGAGILSIALGLGMIKIKNVQFPAFTPPG